MRVKIRYQLLGIIFSVVFLAQTLFVAALPIETTISQRMSIRSFTTQTVAQQQLLDILSAAYGYAGTNRVVPPIGDAHSLDLFAVNSTGTYKYYPETNSLTVWDNTVTKTTISPDLLQSWQITGDIIIIVVWNQTKMGNQYFAAAEAGCLVQNAYLQAVNLNLGTTCASTIDSNGLRNHLKLSSTMIPLLILPLGIPTGSYNPTAAPDSSRMNGNLPAVQLSQTTFTDALYNMKFAQSWSAQSLSLQEVSQLLWAAYGYSSTGHRTTPSAGPTYSLIVYILNGTGGYRYLPETHSTSLVQLGDKRNTIAAACGNQLWAANAPSVFLLAVNTSLVGSQGITHYEWVEADAGCVIQQILLEASANSLSVNVVSNGLESWNGAGAQAIRNTLALGASIVPLYIIPVGNMYVEPTPTPIISDLSDRVFQSSAYQANFIYADPYRMSRAVATYDVASGSILYGMCQNIQNQDFDNNPLAVSQNPADKGRLLLQNKTVLMFGSRNPHWGVRYLEDNRLTPIYFQNNGTHVKLTENATNIDKVNHALSSIDFEHEDYFVIMALIDQNDNHVFINYGFEWKGTWAAGIYLKAIYPNIQSYTNPYYIIHWQDTNADGIPQTNEMTPILI
jgi:nitroreductase